MSNVQNNPTIIAPIIETYRFMIGHRAQWMYRRGSADVPDSLYQEKITLPQ